MCILSPCLEKNWAGWDDLGWCLYSAELENEKVCVVDAVAGSRIATSHALR